MVKPTVADAQIAQLYETLWEVLAASWGSQGLDGYVEDSHGITT